MQPPNLIKGAGFLGLCTLLSLAAGRTQADPLLPAPLTTPQANAPATLPPANTTPLAPPAKDTPDKTPKPHLLTSLTLDFDQPSPNSAEVLNAKVSLTIKDASFLSVLDGVMNASAKTCRVECRQLRPLRLSMNVHEVPVAGLLDSLAKLSGGRLYVLPTKLILAPEKALTDDEKSAKPYGVLLTAATVPNTPEGKALVAPNKYGVTTLDIMNAKINRDVKDKSLDLLMSSYMSPKIRPDGIFGGVGVIGPLDGHDMEDENRTFSFQDISFGDTLSSLAHLVGCELYVFPNHFLICSPDRLTDSLWSQRTKGAVPAFLPPSTNFTDPSASGS